MKRIQLSSLLIAVSLMVASANAAVWYVHPDSVLNSIQIALLGCSANDTVLVGPGTYYENILWPSTQGIDLVSEYGPDTTIIDGDSNGSVITLDSDFDTTTVIMGFTIRHGFSFENGGGILLDIYSSSPAIIGNVIENNAANLDGGGIYCIYDEPMITGNTIMNNTAGYDGGGVGCWKVTATIVNNVISGNTAGHYGGGINCYRSVPVITGNVISDNHAARGGGIFHSGGGSSSVITGNTIIDNDANLYGGGIYCYEFSSANITLNTISGNSAQAGGGIGCDNSYPVITSNTVSNNIAADGGGIDCDDSHPIITGNTISANCSTGICCKNGSVPLINYNNIVSNTRYGARNIDANILLSAEYNWWGHASGPFHPTYNPGGTGDPVSDHVDFTPWLAAPVGVEEEPVPVAVEDHGELAATIISGPLRLPEGGKCRLYDIAGRIVEPGRITPGVYFMEVDTQVVQKVVKVR